MSISSKIWRHPIFRQMRQGGIFRSLLRYPRFLLEWRHYKSVSKEQVRGRDLHPCLFDATEVTEFDPHYFYQSAWAAGAIARSKVRRHVDVGSQITLIAPLTGFLKVEFVDIRPLEAVIPNLHSVKGSILQLPYRDRSLSSISCLHVVEHIGLGRYGDPVDPDGTIKACKELQRVLAKKGHLYISVPIGRQRVAFNGQRIHDPITVLEYFNELRLVDFSSVDDKGIPKTGADPNECRGWHYGLGFFHFTRR